MASRVTPEDRLNGWEAISHYLGWTPRTVIRWEKQKGLPVHRLAGGKRQPVYAYRHEIDQWFQRTGGGGSETTSGVAVLERETAPIFSSAPLATWRVSRRPLKWAVAAIIFSVAAIATAWHLSTQPVIQITGVTQLTNDGTAKQNLVTDGRQLYFTENFGGKELLSTMPASGGPIRHISLALPNPSPEDISSDGKFLLVLSAVGVEEEHPLWIVPADGGTPHEVAGIRCHAAAWSPSGEWIAFSSGSAIYLISRGGDHTRQLTHVDGIPRTIRWSADGKHLLFFLRRLPANTLSLWQVNLDRNLNADAAAPLQLADRKFGHGELLAQTVDGYFSVSNDSTTDLLLHFRPGPWWSTRPFVDSALSTHFDSIKGLAADSGARRLFVLSDAHEHGELVRYDLSTRSFTMMLPGASATFVDFAKNINLVTYVKSQDQTLWVSRTDGSDARQLSPTGMEVELPKWSPDSKWIAFMGKQPDRPWRIFVIPANGGATKEASQSDDNQGAPTWSPDGRTLAYGNVHCQEERTCAIHMINLASGDITTLPESQGLGTARWSPDGQRISALNPVKNELFIFNLNRQRWRKLADGINGNDVSWSLDSRYVYTKSSMNGSTDILRIAVDGGAVETILDLDSFSKSPGKLDVWFSLTPDNALLLNRLLNTSEIYALSYRK
jgi:Tol biopolymer transport system component